MSRGGGATVAVNASGFTDVVAGGVDAGTPGIVKPAELVAEAAVAEPGMAKSAFKDGGAETEGETVARPPAGGGSAAADIGGTAEPDINPGGSCESDVLGGVKLPDGGEAGSPAGCEPGNGYPMAA